MVFFIIPVVLFYMMEAFEHNAFVEVRQLAQVYNILLFELIAWILFFVTGSGRLALRIEIVVAFLYGLVNHYVMAFRSTPFVPWDVFSIKTAASVAGNYDFTPSKEMIWLCVGFVTLFALLQFMDFKLPKNIWIRVIPSVCVTVAFCSFVNLLWDDTFQTDSYLYPFLFTPAYMTKVNGMAVTFAMDMEYLHVEKPAGYSVKRAEEILAEYEKVESQTELPNIIVVMNEAFSDLSVLGDFTTNEDYMPFVHMLQQGYENTITGNLEVSVCGGNTANSEFEFLTGHTMDFFPVGSIPYQQYISGKLPSMASQLKGLGYETYGMHPYNASGWQRDTVYPLLGLETNYFLHDFESRRYIRNYVSDKSAYEKIIEVYKEKEAGVPLFVFEVTMQNHSSYSDAHDNFTPDIFVEEVEDFALNQYLSLMKVSDAEFENLVNYFAEEEEKTILVFFGDHQPNDAIANKILRLNGTNSANLTVEAAKLRYQVPYVIWANYDIEEAINVDTDISFLGAEVMEYAGIPTTAYQNFLLDVKKNPDSKELLEKYQILQYYYMFDYEKE
ncbi:MAG: LTA synthase family protein [Agathobacter sp.]|nr:LTA synthase family protein [Agathobacter sp.]